MAELLEAGYDLGGLAAVYVALAGLILTAEVVAVVADILNFSIFGYRPLHGISVALQNGVGGALEGAIKDTERAAAHFQNGLIDSFGLLIAIPALLALGTKAALTYLWNHALPSLLQWTIYPWVSDVQRVSADLADLEGTVAADLHRAEAYAVGKADDALVGAEAYAIDVISATATELRRDIAAALATAEGYADQAVSTLRAAEDRAIADASGIAAAAQAAGLAAAAAALATAESDIAAEVATARADAAAALAAADTAGKVALAGVKSIAITAEDELGKIEGDLGALGTGALIASIPALATLVHAIASEAGLENAECRGKVKGICGTDPNAWANLLGGLAAIGFAFSLADLVKIAEPLAAELAPVIARAG